MSAQSKRDYVQAIYQRHRRAGRPEKRLILDEFCQATGYALANPRQCPAGSAPAPVRRRVHKRLSMKPSPRLTSPQSCSSDPAR